MASKIVLGMSLVTLEYVNVAFVTNDLARIDVTKVLNSLVLFLENMRSRTLYMYSPHQSML